MLDKSLLNAYGEPVHTHPLSLHLPSPSGSQEAEFLPDRRQTALRSVAGGEPHALLYGSSFCAKAFAPVKGKGHSHHTAGNLRLVSLSLFALVAAHANKCLFGQRGVNTSSYIPPAAPDVAGQLRYGCVRCNRCALESVLSAHWSHGHPACSALSVIDFVFFLLARHSASSLALCSCFVRQFPIAPCTSIRLRKCLRLRLWLATHGVCRSAYGLRCAAAQCSVKSVLQRLWRARAQSTPSFGWFFIPIPCKPNTLTALGGVRAVS